jgi:uncharacterized membrane protein YedE/YeeE
MNYQTQDSASGAFMTNFTPFAALTGGILIGISAAAMLILEGKVAGISGIFAGILRPVRDDTSWRLCFVLGLLAGGLILRIILPQAFQFGVLHSMGTLAVAGLLVGAGTRLGNGCTSGHGVCGVGRLSKRSMAATFVFVATGAAVVFIVNHLLGGSV